MSRRIDGPTWLSVSQVACLFGVNSKVVRDWEKYGMFPAAGGGGYGRHRRWRKAIIEDVLNHRWPVG